MANARRTFKRACSAPSPHKPIRGGNVPSLPDVKTIRFRQTQFLEIVLNKEDSVSATKDCSLFMEQEYALCNRKLFLIFPHFTRFLEATSCFQKYFPPFLLNTIFLTFFSCCRSVTSILPFHKISAVSGLDYPKKNECSFKLLASLLVWETRRGDIPYSSNTAFFPFLTFSFDAGKIVLFLLGQCPV